MQRLRGVRCDLDPSKICDNCCRCIALEDEDSEFRSRTISLNGTISKLKKSQPVNAGPAESFDTGSTDEPYELTPELIDYWEKKLLEYGEAPADDGFGEIEVSEKNPVYGKRARSDHKRKH